MNLSKSLKKLLISSAALLLFASVGATASNGVSVNARRVRTHRVYRHKNIKRSRRIHRAHHTRKVRRHAKRNVRRWNHKRNVHKYHLNKLKHRRNTYKWRHYRKYHHSRRHLSIESRKTTHHYLDNGFNPFTASFKEWNKVVGQHTPARYPVVTGFASNQQKKIYNQTYSPSFRYGNQVGYNDANSNGCINWNLRNNPGYAYEQMWFNGNFYGLDGPIDKDALQYGKQTYENQLKNIAQQRQNGNIQSTYSV